MLSIPECVPQDLVEDLEACQRQLRILIGNYQVTENFMSMYHRSNTYLSNNY